MDVGAYGSLVLEGAQSHPPSQITTEELGPIIITGKSYNLLLQQEYNEALPSSHE